MSDSKTVTIACKHPNGMVIEATMKNGEVQKQYLQGGRQQTTQFGAPVNLHAIAGGFGLTPGVSREFWEAHKKEYEGADWLTSGIVFANETSVDGDATEKDAEAIDKSIEQLSPMDPNAPAPGLEPVDADKVAKTVSANAGAAQNQAPPAKK